MIRLMAAPFRRAVEIAGRIENEPAFGIVAVFQIAKLVNQGFCPLTPVGWRRKFVDGAAPNSQFS